ncbi:hypothetical protein AAE478_000712 [Parahypoxylon ruwenzoriense]
MKNLLPFAALSCTANAIHSVSVRSNTPYDCNAVSGVDASFSPDEHSIHVDFPTISLTPSPPAHGYPGGDSYAGCDATVEFEDFPTQVRFGISNVTWYNGRLNLSENDFFYSLTSRVNLTIEHEQNFTPIKYPIIKDSSSANLLDLNIDPGIGNKSYEGEFKYMAENPNLIWSSCFGGYLSNATKLTFSMTARTKKGGTSSPGWKMDFGLVWEKCYPPDDTNWGQRVIRNWESCTYSNQTSLKRLTR